MFCVYFWKILIFWMGRKKCWFGESRFCSDIVIISSNIFIFEKMIPLQLNVFSICLIFWDSKDTPNAICQEIRLYQRDTNYPCPLIKHH